MAIATIWASSFENFSELKAAYYVSDKAEVRMGIIYALLHGFNCSDVPQKDFLLSIVQESCRELDKRQQANYKNRQLIEIEGETELEKIRRENELREGDNYLRKMAGWCIVPLMRHYVGLRSNGYDFTKEPKEVGNRYAEEILKILVGDYSLALGDKPQGKTLEEFLDVYRAWNENPPDAWFQACIKWRHYYPLIVTNPRQMVPRERVIKQLVIYLREKRLRDDAKLTEDVPITWQNTRGIWSKDAADFLFRCLCENGAFDPVLSTL